MHNENDHKEDDLIAKEHRKSLTIVLVNYNGWGHTIECLESLLHSDRADFHIIIVDNGSNDDSIKHVKYWAMGLINVWVPPDNPHRIKLIPPRLKPIPIRVVNGLFMDLYGSDPTSQIVLIQSSSNGGFGAGNNLGMACAFALGINPDYFWLLNNDTVVDHDAVGIVLDSLTGARQLLGTWLMEYDTPEVVQVIGGCRLTRIAKRAIPCQSIKDSKKLDFIQGASIIFPTKFFLETGGFDESIFMYFEDADLCFLAREKGYDLAVIAVPIYHKGGASSQSLRQWIWAYQHKFYVLHKHFGWGFWTLANVINLLSISISPSSPPAKKEAARVVLWKGICSCFDKMIH